MVLRFPLPPDVVRLRANSLNKSHKQRPLLRAGPAPTSRFQGTKEATLETILERMWNPGCRLAGHRQVGFETKDINRRRPSRQNPLAPVTMNMRICKEMRQTNLCQECEWKRKWQKDQQSIVTRSIRGESKQCK